MHYGAKSLLVNPKNSLFIIYHAHKNLPFIKKRFLNLKNVENEAITFCPFIAGLVVFQKQESR